MNIILFDRQDRRSFLPLAYTRSVADFRCGILTLKEKWESYFLTKVSVHTTPHLQYKYNLHLSDENVLIDSNLLAEPYLVEAIADIDMNNLLLIGDAKVLKLNKTDTLTFLEGRDLEALSIEHIDMLKGESLQNCRDVFLKNGDQIKNDFQLLTKGKKSQELSSSNTLIGEADELFIEEGASIEASILNTKTGPIYIGENATIMEGSIVRGGLGLCDNATIKMGAKIYGPTTIGPHCKAGGEIGNSVLFGYSNKGHDGYIGNAVLGEWCNLGADTNSSNLKNNYGLVKAWNYETEAIDSTGEQFVGLIMGDHAKAGINTMFNTATTVGVAANIFGAGFPTKFIPSFTWGAIDRNDTFQLEKCFEMAENMMSRRGITLSADDKKLIQYIFESTEKFRN